MTEVPPFVDRRNLGFERWFDTTRTGAVRFHHRLRPPPAGAGETCVLAAAREEPFPHQLHSYHWTLALTPHGPAWCLASIIEEASVSAAHVGLTSRLNTVSAAHVDLGPVLDGPGDITAFWYMARDNVRVDGYPAVPTAGAMAHNTAVVHQAFAAIDEYLLSNWPLAAAEHSGVAMEPLEVEVSVAKQVKREEETELVLAVKQRGQRLPLDGLSFRVLMEPGRLRWDDGRLLYWSSQAGPATITADVFVEPSAYGQGVARLDVND